MRQVPGQSAHSTEGRTVANKPLRPMLSSLASTVSPPSSEFSGFRFLSCKLNEDPIRVVKRLKLPTFSSMLTSLVWLGELDA